MRQKASLVKKQNTLQSLHMPPYHPKTLMNVSTFRSTTKTILSFKIFWESGFGFTYSKYSDPAEPKKPSLAECMPYEKEDS